ncbi:CHAT domain-containing protein [Aspergillus caelatus]|uniref:CHAT domain-containing protein n=1 Tax=Aspergillus caelatus TaxID=61420 RepID=A0A5N7ANQ4_9EURO|nr:CHAT domain-containing protein [Aspergillus caelatus]KAE8370628.1 CHAT domain-containing protein [Aspergillus caelatus]
MEYGERGNSPLALVLASQGRNLLQEYYEGGDPACLDESIDCARQALDNSTLPERAIYLNDLGCRLRERYDATEEIHDISEAIDLLEDASQAIHDRTKRVLILNNLATFLGDRFEIREDVRDLERAIAVGQDALSASSSSQGLQAMCLNTLSLVHGYRYRKLASLDDLQTATQMGQRALDLTPAGHPDRMMYLGNLGVCYERQFDRLQRPADIERAIDCATETVALSDNAMDSVPYLTNLSNSLASRFLLTADPQDLENAIVHAKEAIQLTPPEYPKYSELLHNLSLHLGDRFRRYGDVADLDEAIKFQEDAIAAGDLDNPRLVTYQDQLGVLLCLRYDRNDDVSILENAIELAQDVLHSTGNETVPDQAQYLSHMAACMGRRFERTGNVADLERAIHLEEQAIEIIPHDDPHRMELLLDLSDDYHNRSVKLGSTEDRKKAIETMQMALIAGVSYHSHRSSQLCRISQRFKDRYESTRDEADITESMKLARKAVELVPPDHPRRPYYLHCLSLTLETRFLVLGSLPDLETSIQKSEEALAANPHNRHDYLYALSIQLTCRYEQLGALVDLQEAIRFMQDCIKGVPSNYAHRIVCLKALSDQLGSLYVRNHNLETLNEAVDAANKAAALVPKDDMMRPSILNSLHLLLVSRSKATNTPADLVAAIKVQREALDAPDTLSDRTILLHNLSQTLAYTQKESEQSVPREAVELSWETVNTAVKSHPNRAMYLNTFGTFLKEGYGHSRKLIHENQKPQDLFQEGLRSANSPPLDRIKAGQNAFDCYIADGQWANAVLVATEVVRLFPLLVPRWLSRDDQQYLLKNISHFTSRAASVVLQANGSPAEAINVLEAGRGVIARFTTDLKTDISKLEKLHPALHAEYIGLRRQILLPPSPILSWEAEPTKATIITRRHRDQESRTSQIITTGRQRAEILRKLEEIEKNVRELPEFEQFMKPLSPADHMSLARLGPIIAFNVTELRSDAIIVTESGIDCIRLERLQFQDLKANVNKVVGENQLSKGPPSERPRRNEELQRILNWLWETALHPVLTKLRLYSNAPPGPLSRVWWVASGYMGLLPLHAAGDGNTSTMDYVISSYTPTLQVLKFSRERDSLLNCDPELRMLLITAPDKPGRGGLDTETEIKSIQKSFRRNISYTLLNNPSNEDVLRELSEHHLIHFSCHGYSNATDPSESALEIAYAAGSRSGSLLTVRDIATIDHAKAQIAYLSACSTAENSSDELLDEVIHIAGAFQLIGFPHVLGTLWEVSDRAAVEVSRLFYEALSDQVSSGSPSHGNIASTLHEALRTYRKSKKARERDVLSWAPFIYMGA